MKKRIIKAIEKHYSGLLTISEIEINDDIVLYRATVKCYFIPMCHHTLIDADFSESWVKMYAPIELFQIK